MQYRIRLYDDELPIEMQSDPVDVEADREPDTTSDEDFIIFYRDGAKIALFRRKHVRAIHEVSRTAAGRR